MGSTSVSLTASDFPGGFFNATPNPDARLLSVGGISVPLSEVLSVQPPLTANNADQDPKTTSGAG